MWQCVVMEYIEGTLILIIAQSYQVVYGIDDIRWIAADDLDAI